MKKTTTKASHEVAGFLFNSAKNGSVSAQIFWLKTRARWRETTVELQHSGSIATQEDLTKLSDEELMARINVLAADLGYSKMKLIEQPKPTNSPVQNGHSTPGLVSPVASR
jgi:hypothetical protein